MIMRAVVRSLVAVGAVSAGLLFVPVVPAGAATGEDFGEHVSTCAQTMGFDATHNPGMHEGYAGWDPTHEC